DWVLSESSATRKRCDLVSSACRSLPSFFPSFSMFGRFSPREGVAVTSPTVLVATWRDGLFAVTGDTRNQEIAGQSVRGLRLLLANLNLHAVWQSATVFTLEQTMRECCASVRAANLILSTVSTVSRGGIHGMRARRLLTGSASGHRLEFAR